MEQEKNKGGMMSVIAALGANVLVAISKFIGFAASGSAAMLNESIHSIVDCGNEILLLVGNKQAEARVSDKHPFGQARAKYFYSMVVAMMLFFAGGALGIMEAAEKLFHPEHSVENTWLVMGILVFGLIVETVSLRVALKEIEALNKENLSLYKFLRESRHSEILIIFAEDSCAVVGLLIAFGGTLLSHFTNNPFYDALSGVLIGLLLCGAALFLAREFYSLLIGESVTTKDLVRIKSAFNRAEVSRLINVKTIHLSPTDILVTAKIDLKPEFEAQSSAIVNDIERNMRADFASYNIFIYIEIDEYKDGYKRS
ncbi:cation diffusion facilitator family transporter [Prevotella nigrescens]|uniref:cation diffusion facilitator family transporter n=1 Tax=Prevotella nigrescens TaxID=28133 RepID=UPI0002182F54|nr:cation diffusion facilitator family transporter [Prevotella nigrescens]EGQ11663.1 CDF family cation diffusion facilitator [Prevotella nigrescens ATCC 33563]UAK29468.1 cation diffusion facilitator family transporter [Prevotella nigrescens]WMS20831.1 cation diffusion facilitator family transporter [Prevotella nigrescens]SUB97157.1 zinc transporter ZitB [Prevotella nigrescens]